MPLSTPDRLLRFRSIREKLLNAQERRGPASTPTGTKRQIYEAAAELAILIGLEYPEENTSGTTPQAATAPS